MKLSQVPLLLAAALSVAAGGCQLFIETDVGKGIGQSCAAADECQGGTCTEGRCTVECAAPTDCPAPASCEAGFCRLKQLGTQCTSSEECEGGSCFQGLCTSACSSPADCPAGALCTPNGVCERPLKVGMIYVGVPQDEGWTLTHEEGRQYAEENAAYLESAFVQNTFLPADAEAAIEKFITEDNVDVVVANSFSLRTPMAEKATKYLDKKFLTCSSNVTGSNLGSYFGRLEQAYYLAGYASALKTSRKRLGFVGSYVTPEVVRHINAYTLGARAVDKSIVVEVRWVGFWFDTQAPINGKYAETRLTEQMLATGCDVIAHNMDNGRSVAAVEAAKQAGTYPYPVYSVGNDNRDACKKGQTSCIGVPYWNWGPLYVRLFDQIHRGTWDPAVIVNENLGVDEAKSTANFGVYEPVAGSDVAIAVNQLKAELAKPSNEHLSFKGPYCSTGQRTPNCLGEGETVNDEELTTMCWFVEGVVEKTDPDDPSSADVDAMVPQECQTQQ